MNIEKALTLLNNNQLEELKHYLTLELLATKNKKQANIVKTIEKYIKNIDEHRPTFKAIQHDETNHQYIIDGYTAYYFNEYNKDLDILPQNNDKLLDIHNIIKLKGDYQELTPNDTLTLNNIKNYIKYYKAETKDKNVVVPFGNRYINANYLKTLLDIFATTDNITYITPPEKHNPVYLTNGKITAIILPLRVTEMPQIDEIYNNFKETLENV